MSQHVLVWIDHQEARLFQVHAQASESTHIWAPSHHLHRHSKGSSEPSAHPADAQHFYHEVAQALHDSVEILIVGPGAAKLELMKHVHKHDHTLEPKIIGIETVDHPSDAQLVAYAKQYFKDLDRQHNVAHKD